MQTDERDVRMDRTGWRLGVMLGYLGGNEVAHGTSRRSAKLRADRAVGQQGLDVQVVTRHASEAVGTVGAWSEREALPATLGDESTTSLLVGGVSR